MPVCINQKVTLEGQTPKVLREPSLHAQKFFGTIEQTLGTANNFQIKN